MEPRDLEGAIEGILFVSGEPVSAERIAAVLDVGADEVFAAADRMADHYAFDRRGIRLVKLDGFLQLCSSPEYADIIRVALEKRRQPKLTQPALEVLAICAYFQPVTRGYIEQVRGVDSDYTVGLLCDRGLIEPCGKLDAPGRPTPFRTTKDFLRVFGITSLEELPELPKGEEESGQMDVRSAVAALTQQEVAESE